MDIQVIAVPYDTARRGVGMGAGPEHWLARGLDDQLKAAKHDVRVTVIEDDDPAPAEIKTAFALNRALAHEVATARASNRLPLALAGNCNTALGTLSGVGMGDTALVWFDAHGDFNSPDMSGSGFFDGMGLNIAAGLSWQRLAASIPGYSAIPGAHIIHVGGRAFDADEREALVAAGAAVVDAESIRRDGVAPLIEALDALPPTVRQVYIHLDLDVLDPGAGLQANRFPEPDGLSVAQVGASLREIRARLSLAAMALTAYDPSYDSEGQVLKAGFELVGVGLGSD